MTDQNFCTSQDAKGLKIHTEMVMELDVSSKHQPMERCLWSLKFFNSNLTHQMPSYGAILRGR